MVEVEVLLRCNYIHASETSMFHIIGARSIYICEVIFKKYMMSYYRIITICHSFKGDKPLSGCRKSIIGMLYKIESMVLLFFGGLRSSKTKLDVDYSSYLGPDYKNSTL